MNKKLISIIMPSFNYGHFVTDALRSLIAQTYLNFECIVVDDGSTDDTQQVVESFAATDDRIIYIRQENLGLPAARNTGLRMARGKFIQFLDADDLLQPKKLEAQITFLEWHSEVDVVFGKSLHFESVNSDQTLEIAGLLELPLDSPSFLLELLVRNVMVVSAPLLRRSVCDAVGLFDIRLRALEDWEYWLRCALAGFRFTYDEADVAATLIRFHPASMSRNKTLMLETMIWIREELAGRLPNRELVEVNANELTNNRMSLGIEKMRLGQRMAGLQELLQNFKRCGNVPKLLFGLKVLITGK